MEKNVGFEPFAIAVTIGLFDEPIDFSVKPLDRGIIDASV